MMGFNYLMVPIQCQVFKIFRVHHKKHETLPNNPPVYIYTNRINNKLLFKKKDG